MKGYAITCMVCGEIIDRVGDIDPNCYIAKPEKICEGCKKAITWVRTQIENKQEKTITKECRIARLSEELAPYETDNEEFTDCYVCSNCNHRFKYSFWSDCDLKYGLHFCPNCGEGVQK